MKYVQRSLSRQTLTGPLISVAPPGISGNICWGMASLSSHLFVVNNEGKGVMLFFRLQVFICKPTKKLKLSK
jgi:hypothetical protein